MTTQLLVPKGYEAFRRKRLEEVKKLTDEHLKDEASKIKRYVT